MPQKKRTRAAAEAAPTAAAALAVTPKAAPKPKPQRERFPPRVFTDDEWKEMLEGYHKLPKSGWDSILPGTQIRAERLDGKKLSGGYVDRLWVDTKKANELTLTVRSRVGTIRFNLGTAALKNVWVQGAAATNIVAISDAVTSISSLEKRVRDLESDLERMKILLGKVISKVRG
jgi:hypothetical protein